MNVANCPNEKSNYLTDEVVTSQTGDSGAASGYCSFAYSALALQDWNACVGVFPEREEIFTGCERPRLGEMRYWETIWPVILSFVLETGWVGRQSCGEGSVESNVIGPRKAKLTNVWAMQMLAVK
jgi:hypothetical protein